MCSKIKNDEKHKIYLLKDHKNYSPFDHPFNQEKTYGRTKSQCTMF